MISTLRKLQSENPKEYWRIIQGKRTSEKINNISLAVFKEHFEKLSSEYGNEEQNETNIGHGSIPDANLNQPFTTTEVGKLIF